MPAGEAVKDEQSEQSEKSEDSESILGKRFRSDHLTDKEIGIWIKIGEANKRGRYAQMQLYVAALEMK